MRILLSCWVVQSGESVYLVNHRSFLWILMHAVIQYSAREKTNFCGHCATRVVRAKPWAKHRNNYADAMSVLWLNGACCSWSTCLVRNHKCSHVLLCRIRFHQSENQYKTQNRTISQRNIISVSFQNQANLCYFLSHPLQENRSITSQIPWCRGWIWLKCTDH